VPKGGGNKKRRKRKDEKRECEQAVKTTTCLALSTKRLVAAAKFLVEATENSFVVPNFVAVTKPFFPV